MNNSTNLTEVTEKISGWVSQPDGRGTIDILWSCVLTCCLCCWTIQCLNVPAEGESQTRYFCRKLKWAFITILGPEILLIFAAGQWATAARYVQKFDIGGYDGWTLHHAFFAEMGGFVVEDGQTSKFPVNNAQIHYLVTHGFISFPDVARERITDRDKADTFARAITLWQVLWFGCQCLGRIIQHLPLTTMELSTLAFVFCSLPTFWCWSKKPLDVQTTIVLKLNKSVQEIKAASGVKDDEDQHGGKQRTPFDFMDPHFWSVSTHGFNMVGIKTGPKKFPQERIPNDRFAYVGHFKVICGQAFSMAYMAINFAAWNFSFPTPLERILWRVCCVAMVVQMAISAITMELMPGRFNKASCWTKTTSSKQKSMALREVELRLVDHGCPNVKEATTTVEGVTPDVPISSQEHSLPQLSVPLFCGIGVIFVTYSIVRLYFIVEVFVGLRELPVKAYASVQWSDLIPHI